MTMARKASRPGLPPLKTWDDIYDSFFRAVGAPDGHGRNFNALAASIAKGSINAVEVP